MALQPIIEVDSDKCVNCHQCIAVCPVKYCLDGSGEAVTINHETCIGCGNCVVACTHNARKRMDDWEEFKEDCRKKKKIVAIVAPSAAASFEGQLENLNGYLKSFGVSAVFDVSFGAELTVMSYLDHIKTNSPDLVIAQPCPAIVNYIELLQPELLPYLAPADSPMVHTIKMIKEYFPQYKDYKVAVVSPCLAKKREFESTGQGDYNLMFASLEKALSSENKNLSDYPAVDYDSPDPERAVLFSSPGGLMATIEREMPELFPSIRKIEGTGAIYDYLKDLPSVIAQKKNPLILDCLNCEKGCNGGTGTNKWEEPCDILEAAISERAAKQKEIYSARENNQRASRQVNRVLQNYWKPGLYKRTYKDRSHLTEWPVPNETEKWEIYNRMLKFSEEDIYNCSSCGYGSCEGMARAIHNGLNKPENCHHYEMELVTNAHQSLEKISQSLHSKLNNCTNFMKSVEETVQNMKQSTIDQGSAIEESSASVEQMLASIRSIANLTKQRQEMIVSLQEGTKNGADALERTVEAVDSVNGNVDRILEVNKTIDNVAANTNLLAMNAAIEAAHAGDSGRGFAVVAQEIRKLAEETAGNARIISIDLNNMANEVRETKELSEVSHEDMNDVVSRLTGVADGFQELSTAMEEMTQGTDQIQDALGIMLNTSKHVNLLGEDVAEMMTELGQLHEELHNISQEANAVI
ncbi:MAG: [Fe-Fe] hydrogenase large subunit C-terminal domain-containing protein [Spirochaetales bacterium]|nr:[Fe-Fe] hydrogenase large subunit C-terminal domain-containing protein [Spirochaetales bacterium]